MAAHLTPLKRSQLLDLCGLVESVLHSSCASSMVSSNGVLSNSNGVDFGFREHPFTSGSFCDVFEDNLTRNAWRLHDKMLYLVWWSYRPPSCHECGMQDAWVPSPDSEMKCWHCGTGAGTTSVNDIVEELPGIGNDEDDNVDGAGSDDGGGGGGGENDNGGLNSDNMNGGGGGGSSSEGGPVALYTFFYEWLSRMQVMESGKGIVLPAGESLAAVLRAAYDLALLFVIPGMTSNGALVLRGGALYLSLVLHRFPAPFPLFCLAGHRHTSNDSRINPISPTIINITTNTITTSNGIMVGSDNVEQEEELQWVDVELLAALIGVSLSDFFESSQVAVQYLQNVMTVAAPFAVPSILWHPQRIEGRAEYMMSLCRHRKCTSSIHSTSVSSGLSPEHTAMIVALELARVFDSESCSVENSERIGIWLDLLGLYPQRNVYCKNKDNKIITVQEDTMWCSSPLTKEDSPFSKVMRLILPSPCANALLYVFSNVFAIPALELVDMAVRSGLYTGPTRLFENLRQAAQEGNYSLMPLSRRLSPIMSVWTSVYFAVHSEDRLPLLTALQHLRTVTTREKEIPAARVVQRILRKHQASRRYQFNYTIRVDDDSERQPFKGVYFLSYVSSRFAIFTGVRSARKTLTFDRETQEVTWCVAGAREQQVTGGVAAHFHGPVVAHVESESAKWVVDCARQGLRAMGWQAAVRHLDRCGRVRRRMRVPMLASRLDALASVREATALAAHPIAGAATLLGWGETELLLRPPGLPHSEREGGDTSNTNTVFYTHTPALLRRELQENMLSLPQPSLVFGVSENRVIAMYAVLVALLERIDQQLRQQRRGQQVAFPLSFPNNNGFNSSGTSVTWVDVLLHEDNDDEDEDEDENYYNEKMEQMDTCLTPGGTPRPKGTGNGTSPLLSSASYHQQQQQQQQQQQFLNNGNCVINGGGSPMLLPASTAVIGLEQQQKSTSERGREFDSIPSYQEVMLGLNTNNKGNNTNRLGNSGRNRNLQHREKHQRRGNQQRSRSDIVDGVGRRVGETIIPNLSCSSFNLFSAEECRKRLYRLLQFISAYKAQKNKLENSNTESGGIINVKLGVTQQGSSIGRGEVNSNTLPTTDISPSIRKDFPSPKSQQQQQLQTISPAVSPRQKITPKHQNTPPIRCGGTPLMLPQSSINNNNNNNNNSSTSKLPPSPSLDSNRKQHHNNNRHRGPSRSAHTNHSEDVEQSVQKSPLPVIIQDTPTSGSKKRHRFRNVGEQKEINNNDNCDNSSHNSSIMENEEGERKAPYSRSTSVGGSSTSSFAGNNNRDNIGEEGGGSPKGRRQKKRRKR